MRSLGLAMMAVLVLLCIVTGAVAQDGGVTPVPVVEQQRFNDALRLWDQSRFSEARDLFMDFSERYPASQLSDQALIYLSRISLEDGDPQSALDYLGLIAQGSAPLQLLRAASLIEMGFATEGVQLLLELEDEALEGDDRVLRLHWLADAHSQLSENLRALTFLHALELISPLGHRSATLARGSASAMSNEELSLAAYLYDKGALGLQLQLERALRLSKQGRSIEAQRLVETIVASPLDFAFRGEAVALLDELVGVTWLRRDAIGAVLPLSGRYAPFGSLVRRGMELALERHRLSGSNAELLFRDGGADAEKSIQAFQGLAQGDRVMAIAGPLTGAVSSAVAQLAQQQGVPLLSLSQKVGLPQTGDYVFRNFITHRQQARALARYAVVERGLTSFAVLYPQNKLGRELTSLFAQEVRRLGGLVIARQSYAEDATDFRRQINLLRGRRVDAPLEMDSRRTQAMTEEELIADLFLPDEIEFPPTDFDALFIPDYAERAGVIAPQLAYYGIKGLPLLGINVWNSPELVRLGRQYVEGAIFVDGFFPQSRSEEVQSFVTAYREAYAQEPTILEAQAFDNALMLLQLLENPEINTRSDLAQAMSALHGWPGVTGLTSFGPFGDAEKDLFLLTVDKGEIVPLR